MPKHEASERRRQRSIRVAARNALARALLEDFEAHAPKTVADVRSLHPLKYLQLIESLARREPQGAQRSRKPPPPAGVAEPFFSAAEAETIAAEIEALRAGAKPAQAPDGK